MGLIDGAQQKNDPQAMAQQAASQPHTEEERNAALLTLLPLEALLRPENYGKVKQEVASGDPVQKIAAMVLTAVSGATSSAVKNGKQIAPEQADMAMTRAAQTLTVVLADDGVIPKEQVGEIAQAVLDRVSEMKNG